MAADIINLRQKRKQKARSQKDRKAEENRVRFGRTKAQKEAEKSVQDKGQRNLDGKKLDD